MKWALFLLVMAKAIPAAEVGGRVKYMGGTLESVDQRTSGRLSATAEDRVVFKTKRGSVEIPYRDINLLEYGQKADRRYVAAVLVSPVLLLSKKRDHFLTVGYSDGAGKQQALIFRVDKVDVRVMLASLEARTGLKVQYQDNEARKAAWGSK